MNTFFSAIRSHAPCYCMLSQTGFAESGSQSIFPCGEPLGCGLNSRVHGQNLEANLSDFKLKG